MAKHTPKAAEAPEKPLRETMPAGPEEPPTEWPAAKESD
jgi:hypothetical protein